MLIMLCFVLFSVSTQNSWLIYDYAIYKIDIVSTGVLHIKFILTTMTMNNKLWLSKRNIVVFSFDKTIHMWIILMVSKYIAHWNFDAIGFEWNSMEFRHVHYTEYIWDALLLCNVLVQYIELLNLSIYTTWNKLEFG